MQPERKPHPTRPTSRREPQVPPAHVLDLVQGRVLDPSTALTVKGVTPRSTVYVGPRLLVSRGPTDEASIRTLEGVAEGLGWSVTVSRPKASVTRDEKGEVTFANTVWEQLDRRDDGRYFDDDAESAAGEVVRLDLSVPTTEPRSPPMAGPCCRTLEPQPRISPSSGTSGSTTSCSSAASARIPTRRDTPTKRAIPTRRVTRPSPPTAPAAAAVANP